MRMKRKITILGWLWFCCCLPERKLKKEVPSTSQDMGSVGHKLYKPAIKDSTDKRTGVIGHKLIFFLSKGIRLAMATEIKLAPLP